MKKDELEGKEQSGQSREEDIDICTAFRSNWKRILGHY